MPKSECLNIGLGSPIILTFVIPLGMPSASSSLTIAKLLTDAAKRKASDIHLIPGSPPTVRVDGALQELEGSGAVSKETVEGVLAELADAATRKQLEAQRSVRFVVLYEDRLRLRVNAFYTRGSLSLTIKLIANGVPTLAELGLGQLFGGLAALTQGLVVVSGPYNAGRTTTVAAVLEEINRTQTRGIMTIESPIEYLFQNKMSLFQQREVGRDALGFLEALRYSQEADIDVLYVGEHDEAGTVPLMLEIAAAGRLIFTVTDSVTAVQTVERILSTFAPNDQARARGLLSSALAAIIVQRLLPRSGGGRVLALEVLVNTPVVGSLIRDGKIAQLESVMQTSPELGMVTLDQSLVTLVRRGELVDTLAYEQAVDKNNFRAMLASGNVK